MAFYHISRLVPLNYQVQNPKNPRWERKNCQWPVMAPDVNRVAIKTAPGMKWKNHPRRS